MQTTTTLNKETIDIVKSTVPILEERGNEITTAFYKRMFKNNPELKNIFNQTNQRKGDQSQALANTVYAAAAHIDQLETILPAVTDRKSTRLNSSHVATSYAVFCLKKKNVRLQHAAELLGATS